MSAHKVTSAAASRPYAAGIWEQEVGFILWSRHSTEALAKKAAIRYARGRRAQTGGPLSWCGGVQGPDGGVTWYMRDGQTAGREDRHGRWLGLETAS